MAGSAREGFRFRGDNRASDDLWRLRPSQILGRRWIRLTRGGDYLLSLRDYERGYEILTVCDEGVRHGLLLQETFRAASSVHKNASGS